MKASDQNKHSYLYIIINSILKKQFTFFSTNLLLIISINDKSHYSNSFLPIVLHKKI